MIEQQGSKLVFTFPTPDSATTFAAFLATLLQPSPSEAPASDVVSVPPSELSPEIMPAADPDQIQDSPEHAPFRSRRTILTPERQDQLFNQRQSGQTAHDRLLRAQTTLRDGVLPFSRPGQAPRLERVCCRSGHHFLGRSDHPCTKGTTHADRST